MLKKEVKISNLSSLFQNLFLTLLLTSTFQIANSQILNQVSMTLNQFSCIDESIIDQSVIVPTIYNPVCGCDGVTYPNVETARYYFGVRETTPGSCTPCDNQLYVEHSDVSCHDASDGVICYDVANGQFPVEAMLTSDDGVVVQVNTNDLCFENLAAGRYTLTVFSNNGCTASRTVVIKALAELTATFNITSNSCSGQTDGCLQISGGIAPYRIWVFTSDRPGSSLPDPVINADGTVSADHLELNTSIEFAAPMGIPYVRCVQDIPAGIYHVLIADENSCWTFITIEIPEVAALTIEGKTRPVSCYGSEDGAIDLDIKGGQPPYETYWESEDGETGTDLSGLKAGAYKVNVYDANQCHGKARFIIESPEALSLDFIQTSEACSDQVDGCLLINGGTRPYRLWVFTCDRPTTDLPTPTISANGDVSVDGMTHTDAVNFEGSNVVGNEVCAKDIPAGRYYVLVMDEHGCWAFEVIEIETPNPISLEFVQTSEACSDQVDGCLLINGGTQPYRLWVFTCDRPTTDLPTPIISANGDVSVEGMTHTDAVNFEESNVVGNEVCAKDIPAGRYYVLVMDEHGCWAFEVIEIEQAAGFSISGEVRNAGCNQNGAIRLTINGPNQAYFFQWSNGATTKNIDGLSAGTYTVQVYTDNDQCTAKATFVVDEAEGLELYFSFDTYGEFACVDPIGGTAPYSIEWINLSSGSTRPSTDMFCIYEIQQGAYMVTVKEANGCSISEIFVIEEKPCSGGVAVVDPSEIVSGAQTIFQLFDYTGVSIQWQFKMKFTEWMNIPGATTDVYKTPAINIGLDNEIEVRAVVICEDGTVLYSTVDILYIIGSNDFNDPSAELAVERGLFSWEASVANELFWSSKAFPTITKGKVNLSFQGEGQTKATITITDFNGKVLVMQEVDNITDDVTRDLRLDNYTPGMYFLTVNYKNFVETHRIFVER